VELSGGSDESGGDVQDVVAEGGDLGSGQVAPRSAEIGLCVSSERGCSSRPTASKRSVMANRGRWAPIGPKFGALTPSMPSTTRCFEYRVVRRADPIRPAVPPQPHGSSALHLELSARGTAVALACEHQRAAHVCKRLKARRLTPRWPQPSPRRAVPGHHRLLSKRPLRIPAVREHAARGRNHRPRVLS
jgi:hypothetical protein